MKKFRIAYASGKGGRWRWYIRRIEDDKSEGQSGIHGYDSKDDAKAAVSNISDYFYENRKKGLIHTVVVCNVIILVGLGLIAGLLTYWFMF